MRLAAHARMLNRVAAIAAIVAWAAAAHALTLESPRIEATLLGSSKDPFRIRGRLVGADPMAIVGGPVTLRFGALKVDIPAGGFRRRKSVYAWRSYLLGVKKVTINAKKATLDVVGGGVELGTLPSPVMFALAMPEAVACGRIIWSGEQTVPARGGKHGTKKIATGPLAPCAPAADGADHVPPQILVTSPTSADGTTTATPTITLGGVALDNVAVAGLTWSSDRGGGASFAASADWTVVDVPLQPGDNRITVEATDASGNMASDTLDVTYNTNGIVFDGVPIAEPDALAVSAVTEIAVRQAIVSNPDLDPATVQLESVDGDAPSPVMPLRDDGVLEGGDKIAADGVHTGLTTLPGLAAGALQHFRVSARTLSHPELVAWSPVLSLATVDRVTQAQLGAAIKLANDARTLRDNLTAHGASPDTMLEQIVNLAFVNGARAAGPSDGGLGAWWLDQNGILGGVLAYDETTRRGGRAAPSTIAPRPDPQPRSLANPAAQGPAGVGSRRSLILAPYFEGEEPLAVQTLLLGSVCPQFQVESHMGTTATLEHFQHLEDYGVIAVASHGDALFGGLGDAYQPEWQWGSTGAQATVLTGTTLTTENRATWERDLRLGRLAVFPDGVAAILPSFVTTYSIRLPASLVYMGACRSSANPTLSSAFFGRGAATYLGYDGYVTSAFASDVGTDLFTQLLAGKSAAEAFTPGQSDGATPPATFTMVGQPDTSLTATPIVNGSFEIASGFEASVAGFTVTGDGRIVGELGSTLPTDGTRMALVSTGLGFTTESGTFAQPVCLPALPPGATTLTLTYDWNFFSEEFLEYCGSQFQDSFVVQFGANLLQSTKIDDLCASVTPADVSFDKGDVYMTGWRTQSIDVTAFAGQVDVLSFAAKDVGDSIYDSAILVDHVRLVVQ